MARLSYALDPRKTVRQNLAFGLRMRSLPRADGTEEDQVVRVLAAADSGRRADDRIRLQGNRDALHLFDARGGDRLG